MKTSIWVTDAASRERAIRRADCKRNYIFSPHFDCGFEEFSQPSTHDACLICHEMLCISKFKIMGGTICLANRERRSPSGSARVLDSLASPAEDVRRYKV